MKINGRRPINIPGHFPPKKGGGGSVIILKKKKKVNTHKHGTAFSERVVNSSLQALENERYKNVKHISANMSAMYGSFLRHCKLL